MAQGFAPTVVLIIFWYASNILVVLSNKYLISNYGFRYPIFITGCHMLACTLLGFGAVVLRVVPRQVVQSGRQLLKVVVLACVFCGAVVLGNVSLKYIPVSFNQAIGATTPFFTAVLSFCCLGQRESRWVYAALLPIVAGILVSSGGEPLFHLFGFGAAVCATCGRALKTVLQGVLLADTSERMNSMSLLLHMAPIAILALLPAALVSEPEVLFVVGQHARLDRRFVPALALNASLAFCMNLSNFMVTKHTSALTLQVLGNAKGVVAAFISVLLFRNPVTLQGVLGYAITIFGVAMYSRAKGRASFAAERTLEIGKESRSLPHTPSSDVESPRIAVPLFAPQKLAALRSPTRPAGPIVADA